MKILISFIIVLLMASVTYGAIDAMDAASYFYNNGDAENAKNIYGIISERANDPIAFHNLGVTQYSLGEYENAEKSLLAALEINPEYGKAAYSLALLYHELGRAEEARQYITTAFALSPNDPGISFDAGIIYVALYWQTEDSTLLKKALNYFDQASNLDPDFPHAAENAAVVRRVLSS